MKENVAGKTPIKPCKCDDIVIRDIRVIWLLSLGLHLCTNESYARWALSIQSLRPIQSPTGILFQLTFEPSISAKKQSSYAIDTQYMYPRQIHSNECHCVYISFIHDIWTTFFAFWFFSLFFIRTFIFCCHTHVRIST